MEKKKFEWKERLICLAIAYGIFLIEFIVTRFGQMPSDYLVEWSTRIALIPLMIVTMIALIPNLKLIALSFPIGHVLGIAVGSIFGEKVPHGTSMMSNHWVYYIYALLAVILIAVILEAFFRFKVYSNAKKQKN